MRVLRAREISVACCSVRHGFVKPFKYGTSPARSTLGGMAVLKVQSPMNHTTEWNNA